MNDELIEALASFSADPLGFVMFAYPWGEGELKGYAGPDTWQVELLEELGSGVTTIQEVIARALAEDSAEDVDPVRLATSSGHGIGKSALVCWIIDWALSTAPDTLGVVTASTEPQLRTKTWAQMAKWHRLSITEPLFKMTATSRYSVDPAHEKTWRVDTIAWSEHNAQAFAGMHNHGRRILIIFDEASTIADTIWEVTEGALTDKNTEIVWAVFGNPEKNTGRFRDCFPGGKFAHRWQSRVIDSRSVAISNKKLIQSWIDDYGEDHDFVRVRVRGVFPRTDAVSFIPYELALAASKRAPVWDQSVPTVIGVDVGRFGPDPSVLYFRSGANGSRLPRIFQGLNTIMLAQQVYDAWVETQAIAVLVDVGGVGAGVVDQLEIMGVPVYPVDFGSAADPGPEGSRYLNKRAEIWDSMRRWLATGSIPAEIKGNPTGQTLVDELIGPTYTYSKGDTTLQLESKRDMKRRRVPSPNIADALAITFAYPYLASALRPVASGNADHYLNRDPHKREESYV